MVAGADLRLMFWLFRLQVVSAWQTPNHAAHQPAHFTMTAADCALQRVAPPAIRMRHDASTSAGRALLRLTSRSRATPRRPITAVFQCIAWVQHCLYAWLLLHAAADVDALLV